MTTIKHHDPIALAVAVSHRRLDRVLTAQVREALAQARLDRLADELAQVKAELARRTGGAP